jgi:hypothetical protein
MRYDPQPIASINPELDTEMVTRYVIRQKQIRSNHLESESVTAA